MLNKSIAYRLSVYISFAVVGVFMAFIIIIFIYNQRLVKESIDNDTQNYSMETVGLIRRQLISTQEISRNLADQILYYAEHENTDLILNSVMNKYTF